MTVTLTREQARAADIVEAMYAAALKIKVESNPRLFNPNGNPTLRRVVLEEAYSKELGEGYKDPWAYDRAYATSTEALAPLIRDAAVKWTLQSLQEQALHIGRLKIFASQHPNLLHNAARDVWANLARVQGKELTSSEMKAITGESGNKEGGSVGERLERVSYMRTVIDLGGRSSDDDKLAMRNLYRLMVHPRGVQLIDQFGESSEDGRDYAVDVIETSESAMLGLRGDLAEDPSLIWRFPPALTAGVATIGLGQRPGLTGFALAWARWGEPSTADTALDIAGNALLALQLVGGPLGAVVGEVLDFVLGVISTAVQFSRDLEQDQAAKATAFSSDGQRLSQGSSFVATALMGATTIIGSVLPGALTLVARRAGAAPKKLVVTVEKRAAAVELQDGRSLSRRGLEDAEVKATDRLADNARRTGNNGTAAPLKPVEDDALIRRAESGAAENEGAEMAGSAAETEAKALSSNGTGGKGTGGNGIGNNGIGGGPPPPPPSRPRIGRANTATPGVDNRTAGGGIKFVNERSITLKDSSSPTGLIKKRQVEITGRIDLINGNVPESIFRHEHPAPELLGLRGHDRCHLFPLQWGDEAAAGFMYAPGNFNKSMQKRLENYVREIRDGIPNGREMRVRVTAISADQRKGGGNLLEQLRYEFWADGSDKITRIEFNVEPTPGGLLPAAPFAR